MASKRYIVEVKEDKNDGNNGCIGFIVAVIILMVYCVSKCRDGDVIKSESQTEISNVNKQKDKSPIYSSEDRLNSSQSITTENNPISVEAQEEPSCTSEATSNSENHSSEDEKLTPSTESEFVAPDEPEHKLSRKERRALRKAQKEAEKRAKAEAKE